MKKLSRAHYQRIGEKGGRGGTYSFAKRESARNAANIRWARKRAQRKYEALHGTA